MSLTGIHIHAKSNLMEQKYRSGQYASYRGENGEGFMLQVGEKNSDKVRWNDMILVNKTEVHTNAQSYYKT